MNKVIQSFIEEETERQNNGIELIASENYASKQVREAMSSIFTNKYAEGYPGHRYYGGCEIVDKVESYAIELACRLFGCNFANVQPHSGSQANYAAYRALLPKGGKILSLQLNDGGHLTHGSKVNFSGNNYTFIHYKLRTDGKINYTELHELAFKEKPDIILSGFSAYPFIIDFKTIREICDACGAYMMVDMAHIAGLIAATRYINPLKYADIVTSTTHKTLRGPRGGLILWNDEKFTKDINSAVFPYSQGGPLEHVILAKAICFEEALSCNFKNYIDNVLQNTKECCNTLKSLHAEVSNTETHLFLLNTLNSYNLTGAEAEKLLEQAGITVNKNMMPNDTLKPTETSGIRIGFAAVTSRGCTIDDTHQIAKLIHMVLSKRISVYEAKIKVKEITRLWTDCNKIEYI